jgi:hypothetical protein
MQEGKNWFLPKEINANRVLRDIHWLEIWKNHLYPSMGLNGGSVAMYSEVRHSELEFKKVQKSSVALSPERFFQ